MAGKQEAPKLKAGISTLRKTKKNKGNPVKKTAKITLLTPFDNDWWTDISNESCEALRNEITRTMGPLKIGKLSRPQLYRRLTSDKSKRKNVNAEKKAVQKAYWESGKNQRQHLVLGLNNLYRQLEKGNICAFLVCDNISPKFMIQPLAPLSFYKKVPAAAIPGLDVILKPYLNFRSCRALGLKLSVKQKKSNVFHKLYLAISTYGGIPDSLYHSTMPEWVSHSNVKFPARSDSIAEPIDYSHLYILKGDREQQPNPKSEDFIKLGNTDEPSTSSADPDFKSPFKAVYLDMRTKEIQPAKKKPCISSDFQPGYRVQLRFKAPKK